MVKHNRNGHFSLLIGLPIQSDGSFCKNAEGCAVILQVEIVPCSEVCSVLRDSSKKVSNLV